MNFYKTGLLKSIGNKNYEAMYHSWRADIANKNIILTVVLVLSVVILIAGFILIVMNKMGKFDRMDSDWPAFLSIFLTVVGAVFALVTGITLIYFMYDLNVQPELHFIQSMIGN